jgi:hypothetical protein
MPEIINTPTGVLGAYRADFQALAGKDPVTFTPNVADNSISVVFPHSGPEFLANTYLADSINGVKINYSSQGPKLGVSEGPEQALSWLRALPNVTDISYEPPGDPQMDPHVGVAYITADNSADASHIASLVKPVWGNDVAVDVEPH